MSIFFSLFYKLNSQEITFSDPYSEKIGFNPAYSGISNCSELNFTFNKSYIYDYYGISYNQYFDKYKSGLGILLLNNSHGKGAINNLNANIIYSYKTKVTKKQILNTALQIGYIQQNINSTNLIFNNQINPITGIISQTNGESLFRTFKTFNFSFGTTLISKKYRTGIAIHNIDKFIYKPTLNQINPFVKIHFGKIFSVKNKNIKNYINSFTTEIIYNYQNNFNQIFYGIHIINNIFLTRVFIKHNLNFNSFSGIISLGINYKNIRLSYTYETSIIRQILNSTNSNQISLRYNLNCIKKRNIKNTIYCSNI